MHLTEPTYSAKYAYVNASVSQPTLRSTYLGLGHPAGVAEVLCGPRLRIRGAFALREVVGERAHDDATFARFVGAVGARGHQEPLAAESVGFAQAPQRPADRLVPNRARSLADGRARRFLLSGPGERNCRHKAHYALVSFALVVVHIAHHMIHQTTNLATIAVAPCLVQVEHGQAQGLSCARTRRVELRAVGPHGEHHKQPTHTVVLPQVLHARFLKSFAPEPAGCRFAPVRAAGSVRFPL